ncbi:MAG TPA: hypothetical protein VKC59_09215 [Candidatus Limnocylindrales bacterium]|nr:hypothetical protein [Candidatus Limnocylindrales bacterium]
MSKILVAIETSPKKAFASALEYPGWARSGKSPELALEALLAYAPRYAPVAAEAGSPISTEDVSTEIAETVEGDATTAFGAPSRIAALEREPLDRAEAGRRAALLNASWRVLDAVVAGAPAELRTGPRGGGRTTAKIVEHLVGADHAYSRELGLKLPAPDPGDPEAMTAFRIAMLDVLRQPSEGEPIAKRWTARYAARRIAWHALDHAWEIEDRS